MLFMRSLSEKSERSVKNVYNYPPCLIILIQIKANSEIHSLDVLIKVLNVSFPKNH